MSDWFHIMICTFFFCRTLSGGTTGPQVSFLPVFQFEILPSWYFLEEVQSKKMGKMIRICVIYIYHLCEDFAGNHTIVFEWTQNIIFYLCIG